MKQKYLKPLVWIIKIQWRTSRLSFGWSIIYSTFSGIRPLFSAYVLAKLIATVSAAALQQADSGSVYMWLIILLIIELIDLIMSNIDRVAKTRFQHKMDLATNEQFFLKMYELSQEQFDDEKFNTKLDRARDSLYQLFRALDEISWAASSFISFIGSIAAIIVVAPIIGGIIILTVIPVAFLQVRQNKLREEVYKKIEPYERVAYRSRWMLIDPNFMPEIRLMNAFKKMITNWRVNMKKSQDMIYMNDKRLAKFEVGADAVQPMISFGANIYFFRLLIAGTIGLDRFIFLRDMLAQASNGATRMAGSIQRLHELSINLKNFSEIYDTAPVIPDGHVKVNRLLTIEFKNVSFAYPGTDQLILDDVSFLITPGSKLALVGENGAGKTTFIKLLLRQYLPTEGTITINGTNIRDIKQDSYYSAISNLSQEFLIIPHLPIRDNLVLGLIDEPSDKDIYKITDLVDATEFVKKLPHKLSTRLDASFDDGINLSGGQKQRLGVARALLRNGDIIILDEPTSAIDAKAEYSIFNNIYKSHAGKTTLIVSHRFSTVRKADKIIVLERGKITEYGTHEELLKHGGLYKEMFEAQAEGYK
jgi:ATP-binding cassette, subfamily B, bacterial